MRARAAVVGVLVVDDQDIGTELRAHPVDPDSRLPAGVPGNARILHVRSAVEGPSKLSRHRLVVLYPVTEHGGVADDDH